MVEMPRNKELFFPQRHENITPFRGNEELASYISELKARNHLLEQENHYLRWRLAEYLCIANKSGH